jgi:transposase
MVTTVENFEFLYREKVAENGALISEISRLKNQIEWFRRQVFGQKSERFVDIPAECELLPGFELPAQIPEIIATPIPAHTRNVTKSGKDKFKVEIPKDLPRETVYKDIPEEEKIDSKTGITLEKIGEEIVEKLAFRPGSYFVKRFVYPKYASKKNTLLGVRQAASEDCIISGSKFDASFMAHIVTEKFAYHMPVNRIIEKLGVERIVVSGQAFCGLLINLGQKVQPLFEEMKKKLFEQEIIFSDDTPVSLIVNGQGKVKQARMWGYMGNKPGAPPYHLYEFSSDRCEIHPLSFLKEFSGILHADAYSAYEKLDGREDISWAACWAHGRRKFENSTSMDEKFRISVLSEMRNLFRYEKVAWNRRPEERLKIRAEKEKPIVDKIFAMFRDKIRSGALLPASDLAKAIGYMQSREKNFRVYLSNPYARMDNNTAERGVRKLVIGRKNWLFVGSRRSGKAVANLLSLVQSCRAMGVDPQAYLEDIFKRLPSYPHKNLFDLLPDQWIKNFGNKKNPNTQHA